VVAHGETALSDLKIRTDYAVTVKKALVGFIEIKAPGKRADPRKFKDEHDKKQAEKLKSLPNLIYTDGNSFSLWRNSKLEGTVVKLNGDVEISGDKLKAPSSLQNLFSSFLQWEPIPPTTSITPAIGFDDPVVPGNGAGSDGASGVSWPVLGSATEASGLISTVAKPRHRCPQHLLAPRVDQPRADAMPVGHHLRHRTRRQRLANDGQLGRRTPPAPTLQPGTNLDALRKGSLRTVV